MTFYWWSHWFWITLLSNILLAIVCVHSYPSHDIAPDYNSNNSDNENTKTSVTKLYNTTIKFIWATTTSTPPIRRVTEETVGQTRTGLPRNSPRTVEAAAADKVEEEEETNKEVATDGKKSRENVLAKGEANHSVEYGDYEVKRSTDENENNSNKIRAESETANVQPDQKAEMQSDEAAKLANSAISALDQRSGGNKASEEKSPHPKGQEKELKDFSVHLNITNSSRIASSNNKTETQTAAAASSWIPSQPQIESDSHATVECLDRKEPQSTHNQQADEEDDDNPSGGHKVSFTLENVNKEEEILRAESEHRSRKSKVLSAEYNHVSRFINFSTDSKNLLTRSALSSSNEYDSDEGNISSEALAIKRTTYFLDASAISAICLTAFGVCCTVGMLGVVLYRRRFLNKPQVLSEPDSSVYIDDSTIRDNSDEMYSLDNDSFLNSLEAMTIQNYWTDTVKHTKL